MYNLSGDPPAIDYARNIDPTFRDDVSRMPRSYILRSAIDAKSAVQYIKAHTPANRFRVLKTWILDESAYFFKNLSDDEQFYLKIDICRLKGALKGHRNEK